MSKSAIIEEIQRCNRELEARLELEYLGKLIVDECERIIQDTKYTLTDIPNFL